ncbi:MAG: 1-acyl-sn-glycerol-3-phosphate acyltransferase [Pseudomonadota bacterium]|nr:1-acyl-sn-glycerol-3-phosphate acyltransferase [Pseudomonadota bacterium]
MLLFRSLIFVFFHVMTAIVFSLIGVLLWPLPFKLRYIAVSRWAVLNLWLLEKICGVRYEVEGRENISGQASVILCKHQSSWETLALQAVFPPQVWVLKRELLWIPFFGWGLASLKPIAIDRAAGRQALNQIIEQGKKRLSDGYWVVVFPEGTRIPSGKMGRFGVGGAKLAVEAGVPITPVAHDAGKAWPRHGLIKYPGVIKLVIGPVISNKNQTAAQLNQIVHQWMTEQMLVLEGQQATTPAKEDAKHG